MSEMILGSLITLGGIIFTGWVTLTVARRSERAQRRKEDAERAVAEQAAEQSRIQSVEESLWKRMEQRLKEQDSKIETLTKRLEESERGRRSQEVVIRKLEDRERDREELILDFLERHVAVDAWFNEGGYTPPMPDPTWRITQAVEQYLRETNQ